MVAVRTSEVGVWIPEIFSSNISSNSCEGKILCNVKQKLKQEPEDLLYPEVKII
jgi:hypothetical protein